MSAIDDAISKLTVDGFYPLFYLSSDADLQAAFGSDLHAATVHYVQNGINEGRMPNPFIDPKFYLNKYQDVIDAFGSNNFDAAVHHWMSNGLNEGRQGSACFDIGSYLKSNPDLVAAFGPTNFVAAFQHWKSFGHNEGRKTTEHGPQFSVVAQPVDFAGAYFAAAQTRESQPSANINFNVSVNFGNLPDVIHAIGDVIVQVMHEIHEEQPGQDDGGDGNGGEEHGG